MYFKNFKVPGGRAAIGVVGALGLYCLANNGVEGDHRPVLNRIIGKVYEDGDVLCARPHLVESNSVCSEMKCTRVSLVSNQVKSPDLPSAEPPYCGCQFLGRDTMTNIAAEVGTAVVDLSVPMVGVDGTIMGRSVGCGTIIDPDGTILTCAHVVVDAVSVRDLSEVKVDVTINDGREFEGEVLYADLRSDIAIVKIKSESPVPAAKLGSSGRLRPGHRIMCIGSPKYLPNSITTGIVSCVDREIDNPSLDGLKMEYVQTDCAAYEGNSGGPMINMDGEIVGVIVLKILAADRFSLAVPIDYAMKIIEQLKKNRS